METNLVETKLVKTNRFGARAAGTIMLAAALVAAQPASAQDARDTRNNNCPTAAAMFGDLVIARPIGAAMTAVGAATFIVGLPFIALGGNVGEAADTLVVGPAGATFGRCLGCTRGGWRGDYDRTARGAEED